MSDHLYPIDLLPADIDRQKFLAWLRETASAKSEKERAYKINNWTKLKLSGNSLRLDSELQKHVELRANQFRRSLNNGSR